MTANVPTNLAEYLQARDAQHRDDVTKTLAGLSDRERRLVYEAAVMGYVRGALHGEVAGSADIPKDAVIVRSVIDACHAVPHLYPLLGGKE
jgi:hypothetical protein